VRWEDETERFNIEGTNRGLTCHPDDYYRRGLYETSAAEERLGCLLSSLTPRQELAGFLAQRGFLWLDQDDYRQATYAFAWALASHPENRHLYNRLGQTCDGWADRLRAMQPSGFPEISCSSSERHFPATLPLVFERDILCLEAWEAILTNPEHEHRWWRPLRAGVKISRSPASALVAWTSNGWTVRFECSTKTQRGGVAHV
jgi:hypothetical protein